MKPIIGISVGDINGIGPEIILKSSDFPVFKNSVPVVFSPHSVFEYYSEHISTKAEINFCDNPDELKTGILNVLDPGFKSVTINPGVQSKESGFMAMKSIEQGIDFAIAGTTHALVTAPISKEAVNLAGYNIPGHTEFLADQTNSGPVLMMLVNEDLRVALTTVHIPVSRIAGEITERNILEKLRILNTTLKNDFGIEYPKIAVLGLNPHAGDGGVIGKEEIEIIHPTITKAVQEDILASGPFPADGFFGQKRYKEFDAILAMYHDQGLAPFKLLSFGSGVNFTAGLSIIRTSPDHGTAFDIAGKGQADPSSFIQAYELAYKLARKRFGTE